MRESIYTNNEVFDNCYKKVLTHLNEGIKAKDIPKKLDSEYIPKEMKQFLIDLGLLKYFRKVDKIQIVYRVVSILVLIQFILNLLFVSFLGQLAIDAPSDNIDYSTFSIPILFSLAGVCISILIVINSFKESIYSTVVIFISLLLLSQVYNDIFIIFKTTSLFYWIPVLIFIAALFLTIRNSLPKRERMLRLLKKFKKCGIEIASIPEELVFHSKEFSESNIFKMYSKEPDPKSFFKNLPYAVIQNPTEPDLRKWLNKKKRNNKILIIVCSIYALFMVVLMFSFSISEIGVYEMIIVLFIIGFIISLFLRRSGINKIDEKYLSEALMNIKNKKLVNY
jgi:hypothetical protein